MKAVQFLAILIRDRWETFHLLRTWISIAGFSALAGGALSKS